MGSIDKTISEINRLNKILITISRINQLLVTEEDEFVLCKNICKSLVEIKEHKLVWIGIKKEGEDSISPIHIEGENKELIDVIIGCWNQYSLNGCPSGTALRNGKPFVIRSLEKEERFVPWENEFIKFGFSSCCILPIKYKGETIGTLHIYSVLENDFSKEEIGFLGKVALDISYGIKSLRTEKELIKSEKRFRELIELLPEFIFETDFEGNITFINQNALENLKYTKDDLIKGIKVISLITPEEIEKVEKNWEYMLKKGKSDLIEYTIKRKDGTTFPVIVNAMVIKDDNENVIGTRGVGVDITERKKLQHKVDESEKLYRTIFENTGTATVIENDKIILMVNSEFEKISGYKKKEVEGKLSFTKFVFKDDLKSLIGYHKKRRIDPDSVPSLYEARFIDRKGNIKNVLITVSMIPRTDRSVASLLDITYIKNIEKKLIKSQSRTENILDETIAMMGSITETKDPYTSGHQKRVADISVKIAKELGLKNDEIKYIETAAKIHDIGKINIPTSILSKPGKISDIEFEMIKTHPQIGHDIIKKIKFSGPVDKIVLQHHERLNGSGYPLSLKGDDILLEAKILGVADVIEAMSSHRPYRPVHKIEDVINEIKNNKVVLYDPKVVNACLRLFKKNKLFNNFKN